MRHVAQPFRPDELVEGPVTPACRLAPTLHACETIGFQSTLESAHIKLNPADELASWVAASAWLLDRYHVLLANEWTEHVRLHHLETALNDKSISRRWVKSPDGSAGKVSKQGFYAPVFIGVRAAKHGRERGLQVTAATPRLKSAL